MILKRQEVEIVTNVSINNYAIRWDLFNKEYESIMNQFDNKEVISINLIFRDILPERILERYVVHYKEGENHESIEETEVIEKGDFVYTLDVNTKERNYEKVEKVEGNKVFLLDEYNQYGFMYMKDCTLVAKAKHVKI